MPEIICRHCGSCFHVKPSYVSRAAYCGKSCEANGFRTQLTGAANPNWKGGDITVACEWCKCEFKTVLARLDIARFCSRACRALWDKSRAGEGHPKWSGGPKAAYRRWKDKRIALGLNNPTITRTAQVKVRTPVSAPKPKRTIPSLVTCPKCGSVREYKWGTQELSRLCRSCAATKNGAMQRVACSSCGKIRRVHVHRGRGASGKCSKCYQSSVGGEVNPNWKGGITSEIRKVRASNPYIAWRSSVFERDKYTCQACGKVGWTLHAHHIKPFSTHPELRFSVDNGVTLCLECHKATNTFLGKARKLRRAA